MVGGAAAVPDRSETVKRGKDGSSGAPARSWVGIRDELDPDHCWAALGCARPDHAVLLPQHQLACGIGARTADLVRSHWGLENRLYRVLDNTFQEDRCRLHTGHAARNYCQPVFLFIPTSSCTKSSLWFPHWTQPARPWAIVPHYRIPACFRCAIIFWLARSQSVVRACSLATMPTGSTPPNFTNTRDTPRI